ncbi:MAG: cytochrome c oxidase subunit 2A [Anaerolinea sp.]|nr:cytochrome c oxidase subunit 2A [Anaerolinea sp.]
MNNKDKKHKTPQGTIAIMVIFVITIIALWGSAYLTLLSRGLTVVP